MRKRWLLLALMGSLSLLQIAYAGSLQDIPLPAAEQFLPEGYSLVSEQWSSEGTRAVLLAKLGDAYRILILADSSEGLSVEAQSQDFPIWEGIAPWVELPNDHTLYVHYDDSGPPWDENTKAPRAFPYMDRHYEFRRNPIGQWLLASCALERHVGDDPVAIASYPKSFSASFAPYWVAGSRIIGGEERFFPGVLDRDLRTISLLNIPTTQEEADEMLITDGLMLVSAPSPDIWVDLWESPKEEVSLGRYGSKTFAWFQERTGTGWMRIRIEGIEGYMRSEYLTWMDKGAYDRVFADHTDYTQCLIDKPGAILRTNPDKEAPIICELPAGCDVFILGTTQNGWFHILTQDALSGYLSGEDIHVKRRGDAGRCPDPLKGFALENPFMGVLYVLCV